jgi:soluble lytic murein transglycosylase-like protein
MMPEVAVTRASLSDPAQAIRAGALYIRSQAGKTRLDPPLVAAAYNAGGVYRQAGATNRWKTRQFPIGTGLHADRFVVFFNQAMRLVAMEPALIGAGTVPSFWRRLAA